MRAARFGKWERLGLLWFLFEPFQGFNETDLAKPLFLGPSPRRHSLGPFVL